MNPLDIVILVVAVGCAVFGIVSTIRLKKQGKGGCGGNCSTCGGCCRLNEKEQDK